MYFDRWQDVGHVQRSDTGCVCVCVGVWVWVFNDVSVLEDIINVACARTAELTCSGGRK